MKKIVAMFMAICCIFAFAGCGNNEAAKKENRQQTTTEAAQAAKVEIAAMKGPTGMGIVKLMNDSENRQTKNAYNISLYGAADEFAAKVIKGEIPVALVPCNLASVIYNKTKGQVQVAAVNTLGVLYMVEKGNTISSVKDLKGKTIITTGKGNTPEYVLNYVLKKNGLTPGKDVKIEFKSEAAEVTATLMKADADSVALLPQPYATAVQVKNDKIHTVLDMTKEWNKVSDGKELVTGVVVINKAFSEKNPDAVETFLQEYKASTEFVNANIDEAASYIEKYGIVEKAAIAKKALPLCNITYIDGQQMQDDVDNYLQVLLEQNPQSVGGKMPGEDFYYTGK